MSRSWLNRKVLGSALALTLFAVSTPAYAGWGHWAGGSSGGSSGSWGSSGGSSGSSGGSWGSSGGSSGSWGSSGGSSGHRVLFPRLHGLFHHHRYHRAHHSSGGSWGSSGGSWGSSGGSHGSSGGSHGSSGGSHGSSGGSTYYTVPATPAPEIRNAPTTPMNDVPAPAGDLPQPSDSTSYRSGKAMLTVSVPKDARVFVNGVATKSTGELRTYVSRGLTEGFKYTYEIRVEAERNGKIVEDVKTVQLQAGDESDVAFDLPQGTPETSLTVHVPSDARVFLGGNETNAQGEVRTFSTTALAEGQEWSSYKVRVELVRNGETVVREEVISLKSGEARTLRFDLDSEKIADARQ